MHTTVLLQEALNALQVAPGGKYIDATYGVGGHSNLIAEHGGSVLALDWDSDAIEREKSKLKKGIQLVLGNYADIEKIAQENGYVPCEGILFDLGLSMEQIRYSGRGFSYEQYDEPLDMRINKTESTRTAEEIINKSSQEDLYEIFAGNAEEVGSLPIAQALYRASHVRPIRTVGNLIEAIGLVTKNQQTIARIFQALRIEVNNEFENIRKGLTGSKNIISDTGRIVIITFHPSEDRLVKNFVRDNGLHLETKKPIVNKKGRTFEKSAKLRIITKIT